MFIQPFVQAHIKQNIKAVRHWPLWGEFTVTSEFPAQRASNLENVSLWWRHNEGDIHPVCPVHLSLCLFMIPPVCSRVPTVLDGFFPYLAQMITIMKWCILCYNFWPCPISTRSFSNKTAKIRHILSCPICKLCVSWQILCTYDISMRGCVVCNGL